MGISFRYQRLRDPGKVLIYDSRHYHHDHLVFVLGFEMKNPDHPVFLDILRWCRSQYGRRGHRGSWNYRWNGICFRDEFQVYELKVRWQGTPIS